MKTVFLGLCIIILAIGSMGLTHTIPLLFFSTPEQSFTFFLLILVILGIIYAVINPLLMFFEKTIIFLILLIILFVAIHSYITALLTIKINMSYTVKAVVVMITAGLGMIYSIFAPG